MQAPKEVLHTYEALLELAWREFVHGLSMDRWIKLMSCASKYLARKAL